MIKGAWQCPAAFALIALSTCKDSVIKRILFEQNLVGCEPGLGAKDERRINKKIRSIRILNGLRLWLQAPDEDN